MARLKTFMSILRSSSGHALVQSAPIEEERPADSSCERECGRIDLSVPDEESARARERRAPVIGPETMYPASPGSARPL